MEEQSGLSELSVISWVSAVEGCPLSRVPLYSLDDVCLCGANQNVLENSSKYTCMRLKQTKKATQEGALAI